MVELSNDDVRRIVKAYFGASTVDSDIQLPKHLHKKYSHLFKGKRLAEAGEEDDSEGSL